MTTILFEGPPHTYLPEIQAYIRFLEEAYPAVKPYIATELGDFDHKEFDVIWRFMGLDPKAEGRFVVHEYNSLSAGRWPVLKNTVKMMLNKKPDQRVFLNKIVKTGFPFNDDVPYKYRDMGIAQQFFDTPLKPEFDFVYAGSIHRGQDVVKMLDHFAENIKDSSLLIIGAANPDVVAKYKNASNIRFSGRVPYEEVAQWVALGRYGLNLVPDQYPYNVQTATKVLEYCALGLPIVSMKYRWSTQFERQRKGQFFWLAPDYSNLTLKQVKKFDFVTPNVEDRRWKNLIKKSGVFDFLNEGKIRSVA